MWQADQTTLELRCRHYRIGSARGPLSFGEAVEGWRRDDAFRAWWLELLASLPFAAYRWETPPVTSTTLAKAFEFVVHDSPDLERAPSTADFKNQFAEADPASQVIAFENLGKDALLVAPCPRGNAKAYCHLGTFMQHAPIAQQDALWQCVGESLAVRLNNKPIWLSTAGGGVPWLHVRLDDRPKYYVHQPYRNVDASV